MQLADKFAEDYEQLGVTYGVTDKQVLLQLV